MIALDDVSRSGITWKPFTSTRVGQSPHTAVFKATAGLSNAVKNRASNSPHAAWKMFIDEPMRKKIQTHKAGWSIIVEMLEAYLALDNDPAIYGKGHNTDFLWSKIYGHPFSKTQCLDFLIKKSESFCDLVSIAHDLVAFRMIGSPTIETFLTDLR